MKIQSRFETTKRVSKYKKHHPTPILTSDGVRVEGLQLLSAYTPEPGDPGTPIYYMGFGMDNRRYVLTLDHKEALELKDALERQLKIAMKLRQIK